MNVVHKVVSILAILGLVSVMGCGPDPELVANGKQHACTILDLQSKLKEKPDDQKLKDKLKYTSGDLKAVIETADEGDRASLEKAIQEAAKEGCE